MIGVNGDVYQLNDTFNPRISHLNQTVSMDIGRSSYYILITLRERADVTVVVF